MDLQHAVLRLFLCRDIVDPAEPCLAYRFTSLNEDKTEYWQMVHETENDHYKPERIHGLVPESKAADFICQVKENSQDMIWLGQTYCVEPYALGFAAVSTDVTQQGDQYGDTLYKLEPFQGYLNNWLYTDEGFAHIVRKVGQGDPASKASCHKNGTYDIVQDYMNNHYRKQDVLERILEQQQRIAEFRHAFQPLTAEQVVDGAIHFYQRGGQNEDEIRAEKIEDYQWTKPLFPLQHAA